MSPQYNTSISKDDIISTIEAMMHQERSAYETKNYFAPLHSEFETGVDSTCRSKMAEWCYRIVDFCKFERESVAIAMSLLDRYLSSDAGREALCDKTAFQLVAMTCLYTAVKVHEPEALTPTVMARLSQSMYTSKDFEQCEVELLQALKWRVNPPTAMAFVRNFLAVIPETMLDEFDRTAVMESAKHQIEQSVNDSNFLGLNASTIALGGLENAMSCVDINQNEILDIMYEVAGVDKQPEDVTGMLSLSGSTSSCIPRPPTVKRNYSTGSTRSPRSVTQH